jgi:flagellin
MSQGDYIMSVITHNLVAININRQSKLNAKRTSKSSEKLSSGYKINRAADDAAGLSISEKMRVQIRGLNQASSNIQDGISLIQTADGAMAEIDAILQRGVELCVQAANDTNCSEDRDSIQQELDEIIKEIDYISENTKFNNRYLLKGTNSLTHVQTVPPSIQGGLPTWASIDSASATNGFMSMRYNTSDGEEHVATVLDFSNFTGSASDIANAVGTGFYTTCCTCDKHYSIEFTDDVKNDYTKSGNHYIYRVGIGNAQSADDIYKKIIQATDQGHPNNHYTELTIQNNQLLIYDNRNTKKAMADADSGKIGAGVAYTGGDDITVTEGDLYLQIGANKGDDMLLTLPAMSTDQLGITNIDVSTSDSASSSISDFHNALQYVTTQRSRMGAYQNRLEYTLHNVQNYSENLTSAESRIRDTDIAEEIAEYSRNNIINQVNQSLLAQANQENQGVLSLLQ